MIDIHSHVIFGVDDGAKTIEDSLALLKASYGQGVRAVIATSHRRKGMFETPEVDILRNFEVLKAKAAQELPDLALYYGAEIYYSDQAVEHLEAGLCPHLADTRFILVEFSMNTPLKTIQTGLSRLLRLGLTPVVAHIERYHALEGQVEQVKALIDMGCLMQVNASHILKARLLGDPLKAMKKRAHFFLERQLVHFVASDMHHINQRPSHMAEAYQLVEKKYGLAYAKQIFVDNQQRLLNNEIF